MNLSGVSKIEIDLTDGTSLEGKPGTLTDQGVWLNDVHRTNEKGMQVPLAKRVFVPYSNILFVALEVSDGTGVA